MNFLAHILWPPRKTYNLQELKTLGDPVDVVCEIRTLYLVRGMRLSYHKRIGNRMRF